MLMLGLTSDDAIRALRTKLDEHATIERMYRERGRGELFDGPNYVYLRADELTAIVGALQADRRAETAR